MKAPTLDVVLPTYNNAPVLPLTLAALFAQAIPDNKVCRLLLCDDGSTDATRSIKITISPPPHWEIIRLPDAHHSAAHARNRGLHAAKSDLVLLLGADILLQSGALAAHLNFHLQHPAETHAAVGGIQWDPRLKPTPLMEWMVHGGPQNNFDDLLGVTTANPQHFFYGAHLSLKRSFIGSDRFDESFAQYGWEDLELGRRLYKRGLVLHPLWGAHSLHHHYYRVADIVNRQRLSGQSLVRYQALHPAVKLLPPHHGIKHLFRVAFIVSGGPFIVRQLVWLATRLNWSLPRLFRLFAALELWVGIRKGVNLIPK